MKRPAGAWVVYYYDWNMIVVSVHLDELDARRAADDWQHVKFLMWGQEVSEVDE